MLRTERLILSGREVQRLSMTKKLLRNVLLFSIVIFLGSTSLFAAPKAKRVKGMLRGTVTYSPTNIAAGVYTVTVDAVGTLSHLGRTTASWQGDISLDSSLQATPLTGLGFTITTPKGVLRGPILWQATNSTSNPTVYLLSGMFQSTSGTRHLQNATAQGSVTATIDVLTGKTTIHLNGLLNGRSTKPL
jgi:hypothetical protein